MRISSFIVLALGIVMLASDGYDELRGITSAPHYRGSGGELVFKQDHPEEFRNAMTTHWSMAMIISIVGLIWMATSLRSERSDPMAPDNDEKIGEDLKQDEANEKAMKENERQN